MFCLKEKTPFQTPKQRKDAPSPQLAHDATPVLPVMLLNLPAAQKVHIDMPAVEAYLPPAHAWHVELVTTPTAALNRPMPHEVQMVRPVEGPYRPATHAPQVLLLAAPVAADERPVPQLVHTDDEMLTPHLPAPHRTHAAVPCTTTYRPATQLVHEVKGVVDVFPERGTPFQTRPSYKQRSIPMPQLVHVAAVVEPVALLNFPAVQRVQMDTPVARALYRPG